MHDVRLHIASTDKPKSVKQSEEILASSRLKHFLYHGSFITSYTTLLAYFIVIWFIGNSNMYLYIKYQSSRISTKLLRW